MNAPVSAPGRTFGRYGPGPARRPRRPGRAARPATGQTCARKRPTRRHSPAGPYPLRGCHA